MRIIAVITDACSSAAPSCTRRTRRAATDRPGSRPAAVRDGARASGRKRAGVESAEPLILHTRGVGFYNDGTVATRVTYRPASPHVGRKAVRFVDETGEDVRLPRTMDLPRE